MSALALNVDTSKCSREQRETASIFVEAFTNSGSVSELEIGKGDVEGGTDDLMFIRVVDDGLPALGWFTPAGRLSGDWLF